MTIWYNSQTHTPLLFAHRGDSMNFPENTIAAFQSAFEKGADGIELDVQLSNQGKLIVVHDYLHDPTQKYPHLQDIFERFATKGRLEIELKSFNPAIIDQVAGLIHRYEPPDYELTSSVLPLLSRIRQSLPAAKVGMIFRSNLIEGWMSEEFILTLLAGYLSLTSANVLHLDLDRYSPTIVTFLHQKNYLLHTLIKAEDNDRYQYVQELGLDQCTFDDIDLLNIRK